MEILQWLLLAICVFGVITPFVLWAQDTTSDTRFGLVTVDTADLRVGPDFAYAVIGQLPRDASVELLGHAGDFFERWDGRQWIQINYGDKSRLDLCTFAPHEQGFQFYSAYRVTTSAGCERTSAGRI